MTQIAVCPLSKLAEALQTTRATHLISLLSGDTAFDRPSEISADNHLILRFNDIITPTEGLVPPDRDHINSLIRFARAWDQKHPLVVHCWAGVSRSPAAAAIIALALNPERNAAELTATLRGLSPVITPNIMMAEIADRVLQQNGALVGSIRKIGRGANAFEGNPFVLKI